MPAKQRFCGLQTVYQTRRSERPLREPQSHRFFDSFRAGFRRRARQQSRPPRAPAPRRARGRADAAPAVSGPGQRPGREPHRRHARARAAISGARCASSKAHTESAVLTCSVPSRAIRAGHALRAIAVADRRRPARDDLGQPRLRAEPRQLAADGVRQPFHCSPPPPGRPAGSAEACVAVITVCPSSRHRLGQNAAAAGSSSESTSSRRRIGGGERSDASASSSESTARRCSPCEPKPRSSRAGRDHQVVEVRARARSFRGRGRPRAAPRGPRASAARRRRRACRREGRTPRAAPGTRARVRQPSRGGLDERAPSSASRSVHGATARGADTELRAAERGVALRERRRVVLRDPRGAGKSARATRSR